MFPQWHAELPEHLPCQISKKTRSKQNKKTGSQQPIIKNLCSRVPFIETHVRITAEYLHASPVVTAVPLFFPLSLYFLWPCCARSRLSCFFFVSAPAFCVCRISYQKPFDSPTPTGERIPSDTGNKVRLPFEHPRSITEFSFFSSDEATLFHSSGCYRSSRFSLHFLFTLLTWVCTLQMINVHQNERTENALVRLTSKPFKSSAEQSSISFHFIRKSCSIDKYICAFKNQHVSQKQNHIADQ